MLVTYLYSFTKSSKVKQKIKTPQTDNETFDIHAPPLVHQEAGPLHFAGVRSPHQEPEREQDAASQVGPAGEDRDEQEQRRSPRQCQFKLFILLFTEI